MSHYNLLLPYREAIKSFDDKDEVGWAFLKALNELDRMLGIYYIFKSNEHQDSVCISIVAKLDRLGLATKLKPELGNKNYYMMITNEGRYALENFKSMAEYEKEQWNIKSKASQPIISNYGNISMGDNHGTLNQSSSLDRNKKDATSPPMPYETKQRAIVSIAVKFIKYLFIPLLVSLLLLYFENGNIF